MERYVPTKRKETTKGCCFRTQFVRNASKNSVGAFLTRSIKWGNKHAQIQKHGQKSKKKKILAEEAARKRAVATIALQGVRKEKKSHTHSGGGENIDDLKTGV